MDEIFKRRSIRKFKGEEVQKEDVDKMVYAGLCAPTARGGRPWHFVVIDEREKLNRIPEVHPYAEMAKSAPLAIVVCGDRDLQPNEGYMAQDLSASTQNILLMATKLGLGSVWCGIYPREPRISAFGDFLSLPENILPFSLVIIGKPDEIPDDIDRFDPERIHRDGW